MFRHFLKHFVKVSADKVQKAMNPNIVFSSLGARNFLLRRNYSNALHSAEHDAKRVDLHFFWGKKEKEESLIFVLYQYVARTVGVFGWCCFGAFVYDTWHQEPRVDGMTYVKKFFINVVGYKWAGVIWPVSIPLLYIHSISGGGGGTDVVATETSDVVNEKETSIDEKAGKDYPKGSEGGV